MVVQTRILETMNKSLMRIILRLHVPVLSIMRCNMQLDGLRRNHNSPHFLDDISIQREALSFGRGGGPGLSV